MTETVDSKAVERLVKEAQLGKSDAWEQLVKAHYGLVYTIAYSRLNNSESAEDLVQEVFLRAWLQLKQLRKPSSFPFWIGRMARYLGTTWFRNRQRRSELLKLVEAKGNEMERVRDTAPTPDQEALDKEKQQQLHEAIQSLPPQEREATLLHYVEGLPKNMVAQHMAIHPATVGRMLERATAKIKAELGEETMPQIVPLDLEKQGPEASIACISAVAALSPVAQQAIYAAAVKGLPTVVSYHTSTSAGTVTIGFLTLLWQSLQSYFQGVLMMGTFKTITAVTAAIAAAGIGGAVYYNNSTNQSSESGNQTSSNIAAALPADNLLKWENKDPYQSPGTEWTYRQVNEIDHEGQILKHMELAGRCKIISSYPDGGSTVEFQITKLETMDNWGGELSQQILNRKFQADRNADGSITDLRATDGQPIDQFHALYVLMGTAGTHLGPLAETLNPGEAKTAGFFVSTRLTGENAIVGNETYTLRNIETGKNPKAVFDIESTMTIGGLPVGKDERTRTMVVLDTQKTVSKGTWTFDMNNPLNSEMIMDGEALENKMKLVISVPGRDEPVVQELPSQPQQPVRTTITTAGV